MLEFYNTTGARNRVGIGLSNRPARLHRLAESVLRLASWAPETFTNKGSERKGE
jgi:hypothetical protein